MEDIVSSTISSIIPALIISFAIAFMVSLTSGSFTRLWESALQVLSMFLVLIWSDGNRWVGLAYEVQEYVEEGGIRRDI